MIEILKLRGRDGELGVLGQHLDRLLSGTCSVVLVEGGAGMGKSRLLSEVGAMARRLSIRVGCGVADPSDIVVQLSVLMEALFEGPSPILRSAALGNAHASPEQRYWLLQDLEALLEEAALKGPLSICPDDVHWADSGTAAALRTLPSRLATVPIGWVVALRPGQLRREPPSLGALVMANDEQKQVTTKGSSVRPVHSSHRPQKWAPRRWSPSARLVATASPSSSNQSHDCPRFRAGERGY